MNDALEALPVAIRFAYDGTAFEGYARQPDHHTVESALMEALQAEGLVDGSFVSGSRTDRGVSALENVVRCDLQRPHVRGLVPALCSAAAPGLWVTGAAAVTPDWRPRHGAHRTYDYFQPDQGEDVHAMQQACHAFVGRHDMSAFARIEDRNPVRVVDAFGVAAVGPGWRFTCSSGGFLWNQVRRMVDAVLQAGRGKATVDDVRASLDSGHAHPAFGMASPHGLLLRAVDYGDALEWAPEAGLPPAGSIDRLRQRAAVASELGTALRRVTGRSRPTA